MQTTCTTVAMKELQRSAVDILIRNGWIIRLSIDFVVEDVAEQHDDHIGTVQKLKLFAYPNVTISEIKTYIRKKLDIVESDQLLSMSGRLLLTGPFVENLQRIYGTRQAITDSTKVRLYFLKLKRLPPMDPRLVSLLKSVGLEDWKQQDKMVAKAMVDHQELWKVGTECPRGHTLNRIPRNPERRPADGSSIHKYQCMFCGSVGYSERPTDRSYRKCCHCQNRYCLHSSYGVCGRCHKQEKSMASTRNKSVHEVLEYLACSHGYYAASFAFRIAIDQSHKNVLLRFADQVDIDSTSLFIHCGARLRLRFAEGTRGILSKSDEVHEGMIETIEIDEICEEGMTLKQLMDIKTFWDLWDDPKCEDGIVNHLRPILESPGWWFRPGERLVRIGASIRLESYTIEVVNLVVCFHGVYESYSDDGDY